MQPKAEINIDRLCRNFQTIQSKVGNTNVMAVIKADAYGHGALPIAKALSKAGVYGFCVALISEIKELIQGGIKEPILHLGRFSKEDIEKLPSNQIRFTINCINDIDVIKAFKATNNIITHLKIDTGMGRMGIPYDDAIHIMKVLSETKTIKVEGVYSHFATAEEEDKHYRDWQLERFNTIIEHTKNILPDTELFHIANSAAIFNCSNAHYNMVRPGLSLYGISPLGYPHDELEPVMTLKAPIVMIKKIKSGACVGYNCLYKSKKDEEIAIIQIGYADGIPTDFSNTGYVGINGIRYPIVGKISMDLLAIRCQMRSLSIKDEAIFWGGDDIENRLEILAKKYNKLPYELLTGISKRVLRYYIND